ncbi:MAG: hypothetical protein Q9195_000511 [Heterodermia aff. obscurata]
MSGLEVVGVVLGVFPLLIKTLEAQEKLNKSTISLKSIELDLRVGLQKFKVWHQTWLGAKDQPDAGSKALWGADGWKNIQTMLQNILQIGRKIEKLYQELKPHSDSQPRARWKLALVRLKHRHEPAFHELKNLANAFNHAVDTIWLYSETIFDSLHGVLAPGLRATDRDHLLTNALQSRIGALELYNLCCKDSTDCTLELDLKPGFGSSGQIPESGGSHGPLYQLYAVNQGNLTRLRKLVIESFADSQVSYAKTPNIQDHDDEFQLFKIDPKSEGIIIPIKRNEAGLSSYLRIEKPFLEEIQLKSAPEDLNKVLNRLQKRNPLSGEEHFSVEAKVDLAYKMVESSIFLLGTPWLSLINSRNLLRLKHVDQRPSFAIQVQTFGLVDLLFDDSEALSETKQLFHIGILLMEIALDDPGVSQDIDDASASTGLLSKLPLVESTMGAQYCKATAFCLQHRQSEPRFNGPNKYVDSDWELYVLNLLRDYYSQVFLRLEELRDIDKKSDHRSRKSWLIEGS